MKQRFLFNKVAIIGVGLIGGSMGMALKAKKLAREVVGVCHRRQTITQAIKGRAIDSGTLDIQNAVRDADLVIFAAPVKQIIALIPDVVRFIDGACIVTDVGSSKAEIVRAFEKRDLQLVKFIGTHPLAGSEKKGVAFASVDLFKDSLCIVTPTRKTDKTSLQKIKALWRAFGAHIVMLSPQAHDRVISFVSHLPHMVAFSLINAIPQDYVSFAPKGLKDVTRIAASDPVMWRDICTTNTKEIVRAITLFEGHLKKLKNAIVTRNSHSLSTILHNAKTRRESLDA